MQVEVIEFVFVAPQLAGKYDPELDQLARDWITVVTEEDVQTVGNAQDFQETFKDGILLCKLMNEIKPGAVKKINDSKMAFKMVRSISLVRTARPTLESLTPPPPHTHTHSHTHIHRWRTLVFSLTLVWLMVYPKLTYSRLWTCMRARTFHRCVCVCVCEALPVDVYSSCNGRWKSLS